MTEQLHFVRSSPARFYTELNRRYATDIDLEEIIREHRMPPADVDLVRKNQEPTV